MAIEIKLRPPVRPGLVVQLSNSFRSRMVSDWQFSLVGKFNDEWVPQAQIVHDHLAQAWQLAGKMDMILHPNNTFVFKLDNADDVNRVLAGGPYSVEDSLLMLQPLPPFVRLQQVQFNKVAVWVTLVGLSAELYSDDFAFTVAKYAGKFLDAEVVAGRGRCSARVQVEIEAEETLLPGVYADLGNGTSLWIGFKYEGLPRICSNCMRIGHVDTDCRKTAFQAKMELTKRLEAVGKKLNAPMVAGEATMEESLLNSSGSRSSPQRRTVSCPTNDSTQRVFKRCRTACQAQQVAAADPQAIALAVVETPSADPMFRSNQEAMLFEDYGPSPDGFVVNLDAMGPAKEVSKGPKRKPKK